jgi:hypothetical protein
MCPCNHFIVRYLRFYRTLSNQALFFIVWYLISIWIELLFVSDRLDKFPVFRLYFLSILMAYKLLVQSHDIPIEYWCVIRKVKIRAIIKPSTLGALQFFIFKLKLWTYFRIDIDWSAVWHPSDR